MLLFVKVHHLLISTRVFITSVSINSDSLSKRPSTFSMFLPERGVRANPKKKRKKTRLALGTGETRLLAVTFFFSFVRSRSAFRFDPCGACIASRDISFFLILIHCIHHHAHPIPHHGRLFSVHQLSSRLCPSFLCLSSVSVDQYVDSFAS